MTERALPARAPTTMPAIAPPDSVGVELGLELNDALAKADVVAEETAEMGEAAEEIGGTELLA